MSPSTFCVGSVSPPFSLLKTAWPADLEPHTVAVDEAPARPTAEL